MVDEEESSLDKPPKRAKLTTVYDAVAGRARYEGYLSAPRDSKYRDRASTTLISIPPEEVLFRRRDAPERYDDSDIYFADRHLDEENELQRLPDSDLLKALHAYASDFYGDVSENTGEDDDFGSLDETALLAMGILIEEAAAQIRVDDVASLPDESDPSTDTDTNSASASDVSIDTKSEIKSESDGENVDNDIRTEGDEGDAGSEIKTESEEEDVGVEIKLESGTKEYIKEPVVALAFHKRKNTYCGIVRVIALRERDFDLSEYSSGNGAVETDWAKRYRTFLCCPTERCSEHRHERDAHQDAIVVAVDGAWRDNGRPYAQAGAGVFFHRDNWRWNKAVVLEDEYNSSQRAELFTCSLALRQIKTLRGGNVVGRHKLKVCAGPSRRLRRVIIKADSQYLVKGMTDWIFKWRDNGYENCRGLPVTNADMFKHLDSAINELNAMDVQVEFWHVRREENREADCLANAGLDGREPQDALDDFFND